MLNIKKNLQKKLSAFRKLTANSYKLKANLGFTLIELLVVIAIIGILSSVVLASLNSARNKGSDAAAKASMQNVRSQAEIWYDGTGNGKYSTTGAIVSVSGCGTTADTFLSDPVVINMMDQITKNSSAPLCKINATGQNWAMSTTLKAGTTFCVDNSGASKNSSTAQDAGTCL